MANLKRNMIQLIKNPKEVNEGAEPEFEKIWTVPFISFRTSREAASLVSEMIANKELTDEMKNDKVADFLCENAFGGKITKEDIFERLPGPGLTEGESGQAELENILLFVANGQQTESTKNFLAEKK